MDSANATPTLESLRSITFKTGLRGYSVDEVDDFLDKAADEVEALQNEIRQIRGQLRLAAERMAQLEADRKAAPPTQEVAAVSATPTVPTAPAPSATSASEEVSSMLALAHDFVTRTREEAVARARQLTSEAQEQAHRVLDEAKILASDELSQLEGRKRRLSEQVERLERFVSGERGRLRELLGEYGKWLETSFALDHEAKDAAIAAPTSALPPTPVATTPPAVQAASPSAPTPPRPTNTPTTIGDVIGYSNDSDN